MIQEDFARIRIKVALRSPLTDSEQEDVEYKIRFVMGNCEILWTSSMTFQKAAVENIFLSSRWWVDERH